MIKKISGKYYTDFWLNACDKLNIKYKKIFPNFCVYELSYKDKKLLIHGGTLNINSIISYNKSKNKNTAYQILKKFNFPVPQFVKISSKTRFSEIQKNIRLIKKPWVTKPLKGVGGRGVVVNIENIKSLKESIAFSSQFDKEIQIESMIPGENYRILIFKNKIIDVLLRKPAFVIGDGKSSIEKLIKIKNITKRKQNQKQIKIDFGLTKYLEKNKLTLTSIPKKDIVVQLRRSCNMALGGETERIPTSEIHPKNLKMFIDACSLFHLSFAGLDFISQDIKEYYKSIYCGINEINRNPSMDVSYFADNKNDNSKCQQILKIYFNIK